MIPKILIAPAVFLVAGLGWCYSQPADPPAPDAATALSPQRVTGDEAAKAFADRLPNASPDQAAAAFADVADGRLITVQASVDRLLPDDRNGSPHQRFVVRTASGQTLMVAHNIGLAPRLDGLRPGDTVTLHGEYVWNNKGGLMHWTHRDPGGRHAAGYIEWQGRRYQ